jgi:transposase
MQSSTSYKSEPVELSSEQRKELKALSGSRAIRYEEVRRAKLILMLGRGESYRTVMRRLNCGPNYISLWRKRFIEDGVPGLYGRHQGSRRRVMTPRLEARILAKVQQAPDDGSTHWSTRKLGRSLGVNHMMVARVLQRADLKPHRFERYKASTDPDFEAKAVDVIGLYLHPPQHAAVFCVDEKTAVQALDRKERILPLSPGRAERHGFEYHRHGTLSLYGALNTRTGEVLGKTAEHHTSSEFVSFLHQLVASQPKGKEIHIIADNLSAHKTKLVQSFLDQHPKVKMHFTPTYSSWLNQIEVWFGQIQNDVIKRGIFTSVKDLARKLMRYIKHYNQRAVPFKWSYSDVTKRIRPAI